MAIVWKDGRIEHEGRVLRFESRDERIMSDVYALVKYAVCAGEGGKPISVAISDCEFGAHPLFDSAEIDATPEAIAEHAAWLAAREAERQQAQAAHWKAARELEAKAVRKGRRCKVVRGRKVPKGTEGVCIWVGDGHYGERCGIKDAAGNVHWTASKNCEAIA